MPPPPDLEKLSSAVGIWFYTLNKTDGTLVISRGALQAKETMGKCELGNRFRKRGDRYPVRLLYASEEVRRYEQTRWSR